MLLQVQQLAARELQGRRPLADAVQRAAAALHLRGVVHDGGAHRGHEALHLRRRHGVVPAHRRLRAQQVAAVVHRHAQAAQAPDGAARDEARADVVGQPLGQMPHAQVAIVPQVLGAQQPVDLVALAPVSREMVLRLSEGRVAAVARRDDIETGPLHERQVAGRGGVERPRCAGLHERALRAAGVTLELVHARAQIVEHHARGLLDEGEPRGDRASPEDRELLHAACPPRRFALANEKARRSLTGWASIVALPRCAGTPLCRSGESSTGRRPRQRRVGSAGNVGR